MDPRVKGHSIAQRTSEGLKLGLHHMVGITTANHPNVQGYLRCGHEGLVACHTPLTNLVPSLLSRLGWTSLKEAEVSSRLFLVFWARTMRFHWSR